MTYFAKKFNQSIGDPKKEIKKGTTNLFKKNKNSKKHDQFLRIYVKLRKEYLAQPENQKCFIKGCTRKANTIEHRAGRKGFADKWARMNDIPLLIDVRFFAPCCLHHNLELEKNPALSKEYQLSRIHHGKKE